MSNVLLFNEETGNIDITPEFSYNPDVLFLQAQDKTRDKRIFQEQLKYLYFRYKRKGEYSERLPEDRNNIIQSRYLKECKIKDIEEDEAFIAVKQLYLNEQLTTKERVYLSVIDDIQKQIHHVNNIPYSIKTKVKVDVLVPKYHVEEDQEVETKTIEKEVNISNASEKVKALKDLKDMMNFLDDLKEKIEKEEIETKKQRKNFFLFDKQ